MNILNLLKNQKNPKFRGLTRAELMLKADISKRAVDRHLSKLSEKGLIKKVIVKRKVFVLKK